MKNQENHDKLNMNFELHPTQEEIKTRAFEALFDSILQKQGKDIPTIEYGLPYPKEEFLRFIVENKNVLLHGSNQQNLETLEPRQANDTAKKSGNKKAVYAVTDPVFSIFFAILDRKSNKGKVESERTVTDEETGELEYRFKVPKSSGEASLWTKGVIYIFDKSQFNPEKDDKGELSGEWTSEVPVRPIAKIEVRPDDFQHLNEVEFE